MLRLVIALTLVSEAALRISPVERVQLSAELSAWTDEFGEAFLPPGVDTSDTEVLLARLQASKVAIAALEATQPSATFRLGRFALYTPDEFNALVTMSSPQNLPNPKDVVPPKVSVEAGRTSFSSGNDTVVDWSTSKCMNLPALEAAHCIVTGVLLDVSEQSIVSCLKDFGGNGCDWGLEWGVMMSTAMEGICLEKDYPYTSGVDGIANQCQTKCAKEMLAVSNYGRGETEAKLEAVLLTQPVAVTLAIDNNVWMYYDGGMITSCPPSKTLHTALAVGYGTEHGVKYFKIRNSWGTAWGEHGHIRIRRGVGGEGLCGIAKSSFYPVLKDLPQPTSVSPPTKPAC
ncbi:cysteine protease family C01A [Achlya hypogyna]|uniref:Cysteine protease family C01A n=1 Tax=Achlya hypogyna TaxID=1202772 RepID=A0A1V9Z1J8_ACHHY|nr:cysteine protease family C01A [Achlya hypogyna]